ncbi:PP2C family protein-serine/threonine phosphatase [Polyangium jinanense]|uniref:Serine/threonine-protein phosphatase n=1 Tax=Polyangium jinanense TaxID=2829994 RepID=A0A9X3WVZ0_9BACT|nr:protein phosphatase 2C domain-containing protein [Polyangium jinanense]MDC3953680.1 serine/threonine-protein phosphatase [Polyangium jinanense]MDC3979199.1 serine/threonine-protein phosphatase [Polyangium jinanense]
MTIGRGVQAFGVTQRGVRFQNDDAFRILSGPSGHVCVVADGMGGHGAGDVASGIAVSFTTDLLVAPGEGPAPDRIRAAVAAANREIFHRSSTDRRLLGMGSTVALLFLPHDGRVAYVAHVGDSRVYLYRDGALRRLTEDHSLAHFLRQNPDKRAELGIPEADLENVVANILTRSLGIKDTVDVDLVEIEVCPNDRFLLCTDGLWDPVDDARITEILRDGGDDVGETCARLLRAAQTVPGTERTDERFGRDDVALIVARVLTCAPSRT